MALDKQRILSELNSVVNQLQSADCGCMGKLFSNPTHNNSVMNSSMQNCAGCGHGAHHSHGHNYGVPCAGEPCAGMNTNTINRPCIGRCNPQQLYSDTYNYLNRNLMQPVVQEVYNDLKSISPANTVSNNPMADHMGLTNTANNENNLVQSNLRNINSNLTPQSMIRSSTQPKMVNMSNCYQPYQQMGSMAGMGPQIVNMMMGDGDSKPNKTGEPNGELNGSMVIDTPQASYLKVDAKPVNFGSGMQPQNNYNTGLPTGQGYTNPHMQNTTNYMSQQHMYADNRGNHSATPPNHTLSGDIAQSNIRGSQEINNINGNVAAQQIANSHRHLHGQHAQGVAKFNEVFPGVMQGIGGELNFDPMAIAIQMNPANQQKVAMDSIKKIMNANSSNKPNEPNQGVAMLQPTIAGVNSASASFIQNNTGQVQQHLFQPGQAASPDQVQPSQQQINSTLPNQVLHNALPQQVYTAVSNNNKIQQGLIENESRNQQQPLQAVDPNTGTAISPTNLPTVYKETIQPYAVPSQLAPPQSAAMRQAIKEPIFPADTFKTLPPSQTVPHKYYEYNTLGQPVEMLDPKMYYTPEPMLPQTLSPQPAATNIKNDCMKYSNVKSTVSKTSLTHKRPVGKNPSKSQLQHIYNQYKGSQSYTQQNIKGIGHGGTHSESYLKVHPGNTVNQAPVERIGDTVHNQHTKHEILNKVERPMGYKGDVPVIKPTDNAPQEVVNTKQSKCRNGLQDMVYTAYPTSAAWSFHG